MSAAPSRPALRSPVEYYRARQPDAPLRPQPLLKNLINQKACDQIQIFNYSENVAVCSSRGREVFVDASQ